MKRTIVVEALIVWFVGVVSMIEGLRLVIFKDPNVLYDLLGPGYFVLLISVSLMAVGAVHLRSGYRTSEGGKTPIPDRDAVITVCRVILVTAAYISLISIVGYIIASLCFFSAQLWVFGVRSWKTNIALAMLLAVVYNVVFVNLCGLILPRHYLSPLFDMLPI